MSIEKLKKTIIQHVEVMEKKDFRFASQLCVLIEKYMKERKGH